MSVGDSVPHAHAGWAWLLGACGRSRSVRMASGAPSGRPSYIIIITIYHYRCRKHASILYLIIQNFSPLKFRPALSTKPFETQREGLALVVFCDLERAYNAGLRPYTFHVSVLINKVNIHAGSKNG
jgi:hypothetical protein